MRIAAIFSIIASIVALIGNIMVWIKFGFQDRHYLFTPATIAVLIVSIRVLIFCKRTRV